MDSEGGAPLACPLLEVALVVLLADEDALSEVAGVGDGAEKVGLHQREVVQLQGGGGASLGATWVQENLRETHTERRDGDKSEHSIS